MSRLRRGSPALIRDLNRSAVLALIGSQGPVARVEIARRLSLSAATVTEVTRELVSEGLIRVVDQAASSGGRPPLLLGLVAEAAHALGVKVSPDRIAIVEVNLDGDILTRSETPIDALGPEALGRLVKVLRSAVEAADGSRLLGIGLGVPGTVDAQTGVVNAPILGWNSIELGQALRDQIGLPVLIDNDVNTLAIAERLYGHGRAVENFLTVTIGRGVGLGIVVGGDVYRGARGGAGEFGHVPIVENGPTCECGMRGCLEALVADPALVAQGVDAGLLPAGVSINDGTASLRELADGGEEAAQRIFANAGAILGRAVAGLVNVLSPQVVIVSGEGAKAWAHMAPSFTAALDAATFPSLRGVQLEVDPWDDAKWASGAAALVLRATFAAPLYERQIEDSVRARLNGMGARSHADGPDAAGGDAAPSVRIPIPSTGEREGITG
ncbi:MAG TPA: ROK family transcriptional regulator [Candidatus Limnocylindrales bacterium]|jgi:predicted NBD/HSP70 family sugar kinase|nr:ROK family transcriptional regulator [Candidatus Limnocylindrales bacterium]